MPVVPRGQRQLEIARLPGGQKRAAETFQSQGGELARAKQDVGFAIADAGERLARFGAEHYARIQQEERDASDETALIAANNRIAEWQNNALYDPEKGAFTRKGKDAQGLPEALKGDFDKLAGEIEQGLATDRQRMAFERLRGNEWAQIDRQVRRHVMEQITEYRANELAGLVDNSVNQAIRAANDPDQVAIDLHKAVSALRTNGPKIGLGTEAINARVAAVQSKTHVGVISSLLASDQDQKAQAYFAAVQGQIGGDVIDEVKTKLDQGSTRVAATKAADEIVKAGGTLTERRDKAKSLPTKQREIALAIIEHEHQVSEQQKLEADRATMATLYNRIDAGASLREIMAHPAWADFDGARRSSLKNYLADKLQGIPTKTDDATWYGLMTQAGSDPATFAKLNLLDYRSKLSSGDFQQLAQHQASMNAATAAAAARKAAEDPVAGFMSNKDIVDNTLALYKINPNPKADTPEFAAIAQLNRMVAQQVNLMQSGGKKVAPADVQSIVDRILAQKVTTPGSWWNVWPGGKPGPWGQEEKRLMDLKIGDVPPATRRILEERLNRRGRGWTDQDILDGYYQILLEGK